MIYLNQSKKSKQNILLLARIVILPKIKSLRILLEQKGEGGSQEEFFFQMETRETQQYF